MQTTLKEIEQLSKKLNDAYNPSGITVVLEEFLPSVSIYIYDSTSESLREFTKSWISIDEIYSKDKAKKIYSIFEKLQNENIIMGFIEDRKLSVFLNLPVSWIKVRWNF